jgi:hypothetical protein
VPVARNIARMGSGRQRNNSSQCECPAGLNRIKGRCAACGPNEEYNAKNGRCTCVKSAVKF